MAISLKKTLFFPARVFNAPDEGARSQNKIARLGYLAQKEV